MGEMSIHVIEGLESLLFFINIILYVPEDNNQEYRRYICNQYIKMN